MKYKKFNLFVLILAIVLSITACMSIEGDVAEDIDIQKETEINNLEENERIIDEYSFYRDKDDLAYYIHRYKKLPPNYITKREAADLGWKSEEGNLWEVTDGMSIGGDKFGNREGLLPEKEGRIYYECDINYEGGYRGAERIVFSNDGLIFYTEDHYESFTQLY